MKVFSLILWSTLVSSYLSSADVSSQFWQINKDCIDISYITFVMLILMYKWRKPYNLYHWYTNKNVDFKFTCFWNNLHQVRTLSRKIGKPNNSKIFGSNKTKGAKQGSQNRLRSPMHLLWTRIPERYTKCRLIL